MHNRPTDKPLSHEEFAALGADRIVYIKPVIENGVTAFAVHNATGAPIGLMESPAHARIAAREHELEVVHVH
ncbi:MAG: DUF1150 family protein [Alphaproteobacteria bacterium]